MAYTWQAVDEIEPISDSTIEGIANLATYNVVSGCTPSYSVSDMVVTIAAGVVTHNGTVITVAGNTVTPTSDPSNPRFTWVGINSSGTAVIVEGDAAAIPSVPELGDNVGIALLLIQAGQTIIGNVTYKILKTVPVASGMRLLGWVNSATTTTSTSAVDLVTISGLSIPVDAAFKVCFNFRKTATASQAIAFGLKLNSTVVIEATVAAGYIRSSATAQVENGYAEITVGPRSSANYLRGIDHAWVNRAGDAGPVTGSLTDAAAAAAVGPVMTNALPNATITDVIIRAINGTSNNNAEVFNVQVWQLG